MVEMEIKDKSEIAKVASIDTGDERSMTKLLSLGLVPGANIKLLQKTPALAIEVNQTQIAVENSVGEGINIWRPNVG